MAAHPNRRRLEISSAVVDALASAQLAMLYDQVDDADNICRVCQEVVAGDSAAAVIFRDDDAQALLVGFAHPSCATSGIYEAPGLGEALRDRADEGDAGGDLRCSLAFREVEPLRTVLIELVTGIALLNEDPAEAYASALGLHPLRGSIWTEPVAPVTNRVTLAPSPDGLALHIALDDRIHVDKLYFPREEVDEWIAREDHDRVVLLVGRGLRLQDGAVAIEEAIATSAPAWVGTVQLIATSVDV